MDARKAAWIAPALISACAAPATIDLTGPVEQPTAQELAARSREKLSLGKRYIAVGEKKLGGFLLEQAKVDAELASLRAATTRHQALAARPSRD